MSKIQEYLSKIKIAKFGEEVRGAIYDAIETIDDIAETAQDSAANSAAAAKASETKSKTSETNALNYMNATQKMSVAIVGDITFQVSTEGVLQAVYDDGL